MNLISSLKEKKDCVTICFGKCLDSNFEEVITTYTNIDFILLGNPNRTILDILNGKDITNYPNVVSTKSLLEKKPDFSYDSDLCPSPDYYKEGIGTENKYKTYILATRNNTCCGCCTFCLSEKRRYQYKNVDIVIEEINKAVSLGIKDFLIVDNDFFEFNDNERLEKILNALSQFSEKITFSCFAKSKTIAKIDPALLSRFKNVGLYCIFLGIDAGNDIDKKLYKKGSNLEEDFKAFSILNNIGIFVRLGFIFSNPYSTLSTFEQNYKTLLKLNSCNLYHFGHLKLMLFTGTPFYKMVKDDNLLLFKKLDSYNPYLYKFKNKDAANVIDFIDNIIYKLEKTKQFFPFIYFERIYKEAEFLNRKRICNYAKDYQILRDEEVKSITEYFEIIFLKKNLQKAKELEMNFINDILSRCEKTKILAKKLTDIIFEEKKYGN